MDLGTLCHFYILQRNAPQPAKPFFGLNPTHDGLGKFQRWCRGAPMPPSSASLLVASPPRHETCPQPSHHPPPPLPMAHPRQRRPLPAPQERDPRGLACCGLAGPRSVPQDSVTAWGARPGPLPPHLPPRPRRWPPSPARSTTGSRYRYRRRLPPLRGKRPRSGREGKEGKEPALPPAPSPGRVPSAPGSPQRRLPAPAPARLPGPCPACSGGGGSRGGRAAPSLVPHLPWRPVPVRRGRGSRGGRRRAGAGRSRGAERPPREARRGGERRGGPGPFKMAPMAGRPAA